jgi:hypothetical protein
VRTRAATVLAIAARGAALFLAIFIVVGLVGELRGRATDLSLWWVDLRDLPDIVRISLLAGFALTLVLWAVRSAPGVRLRRALAAGCALFAAFAVRDAARYQSILGGGLVRPTAPIPLSVVIAVGLVVLALVALRPRHAAAARGAGRPSRPSAPQPGGHWSSRSPRCSSSARPTTAGRRTRP